MIDRCADENVPSLTHVAILDTRQNSISLILHTTLQELQNAIGSERQPRIQLYLNVLNIYPYFVIPFVEIKLR